MEFRALVGDPPDDLDALVVPVYADGSVPPQLDAERSRVAAWVAGQSGSRKLYAATTHLLEGPGEDAVRLVVVNAGKPEDLSAERARWVASAGIRALWRSTARRVGVVVPTGPLDPARVAQSLVEGVVYALWRPEAYRTKEEDRALPPVERVSLLADGDASALVAAMARGEAVGAAVNDARRLGNEPANLMTPTLLGREAERLATEAGVACEILDEVRCRELGMASFLSVAQGSHEPPRLVVLRHRGRGGDGWDLALVGKGITFDSGGISIKPAEDMHKMKYDMTGAASVIAAAVALGRLRAPVNVIAVAPCTENLPGGGATKPGDVFTSMSGKTVEVINTDAEGRLVLIDGISYAQREGARRIVDVATLTGAISIALGYHFTGLFGSSPAWVEQVRAAGERAGDRMWPFPLTDEYREEVQSEIADLRNSAGRHGSSIKAAAFLEAVVDEGVEWAHLDIASTAWFDQDRAFSPKGPQGPAVRALIELATELGEAREGSQAA